MAIIKTVEEIKAVLPKFISNTMTPSALPNFDQAEGKYLIPLVGNELFANIHTSYNANPQTLSADDAVLLKKMQLVSTTYAFLDELALGQLVLTENGFKKLTTNQTYRWEYEALKNNLESIAKDATEVLLNYLLFKKPALWTSSDAYKDFAKLLIKTGTEFNLYYTLFQPQRTFYAIKSRILDAQKLYLTVAIGNDLLNYLIITDPLSANLKQAIDPLKSALTFFSVKEACMHNAVKFTDAGFTVASGRQDQDTAQDVGRVNADPKDMELKIRASDNNGNTYLSMAKDALVAYYKDSTAEADFKTAFEKGPLKNYIAITDRTTGNETYKGVFRT